LNEKEVVTKKQDAIVTLQCGNHVGVEFKATVGKTMYVSCAAAARQAFFDNKDNHGEAGDDGKVVVDGAKIPTYDAYQDGAVQFVMGLAADENSSTDTADDGDKKETAASLSSSPPVASLSSSPVVSTLAANAEGLVNVDWSFEYDVQVATWMELRHFEMQRVATPKSGGGGGGAAVAIVVVLLLAAMGGGAFYYLKYGGGGNGGDRSIGLHENFLKQKELENEDKF
jgi:hypothetical protein